MADANGFDDRVRASMGSLAAQAADRATPLSAAEVRRRANRRRSVALGAAVTVAAVVGGGAFLFLGPLGDDGVEPVVAPSPSSAPTPTPTTSATPSEPSPTQTTPTPRPTSETPSPTPTPTDEPPGSGATEIPAGFTLPNEGDTSDDPEFSDWETTEDLDTPWPWTVCGVDAYEGDATRTDFRQVARGGPEATAANALAVYADAEVGVEIMAAMRAAVEGCVDDVSDSGFVESWEMRELGVGGESFLAASTSTSPDGAPASGGHQVAVVRVGNAIYATYVFADGRPTVDDALAAELEAAVTDFAPQLCVFTVAGC